MSDDLKKLQHEVKDAQRALAEVKARYDCLEAEHHSAIKEAENSRMQLEQAHQQWLSALDAVETPIFLHDKDYRVLRCNLAYQQCAGIPFKQIIGQPYYEVFPKTHAPLPHCREILENESEKADEEVLVDGKLYRSRATIIKNEQSGYIYSMHTLEDITERKRAEQKMLEEKEFSDALIRSLPDIFFMLDAQGNMVQWNDKLEERLGLSPEELSGLNGTTFFHEEDKPRVARKIEQVFATGSASVEARMVMLEGLRDYLLSGSRIETPNGPCLIGFGLDITERKRAEALLEQERDFSSDIVETAQVIILVLDPQGRIVNFNPFMENLTGYSLQEVEDRDWFNTFLPEASREITKKTFQQSIANIQTRGNVDAILTKDGRQLLVEWYDKTLKDKDGNVTGLLAVGLDVTERKQVEAAVNKSRELLQSVVETAPVRIFWKDTELRFLGCNTLFALDAGYTRPEELIGKSDFDLGWKDQAELYRADDKTVMESNSPKLGIEEPQTTPSGDTIWLRTSKVPLRDEGERVIGIVGIYDDITERKFAEADLAEQLEELHRWHDATLGREERILELKHEVNALLGQAGQPPRYPSAELPEPKEQ